MLKYKVEGFSTVSMDDALAQAMAKAAAFASEGHDMHVIVLELSVLPGQGFKAVVEVTIVPVTFRDTLHREAQDLELKHIAEKDYRQRRRADEVRTKKAVEDHFLTTGGIAPHIPDVFLAHLDDAQLKNFLIEKQFYNMFKQPSTWNVITDATVLAALQTVLAKQPHHHIQHHHIEYHGASDHTLTIDSPALEEKIELDFGHAVHPDEAKPSAPARKAAPGPKRPHPGLREDDEF